MSYHKLLSFTFLLPILIFNKQSSQQKRLKRLSISKPWLDLFLMKPRFSIALHLVKMIWLQLEWSPISFEPLTFLGPKKFGPCKKIITLHFHAVTKFLGAQIYQVPNFLGTKMSGAQMRPGTISVKAHDNTA